MEDTIKISKNGLVAGTVTISRRNALTGDEIACVMSEPNAISYRASDIMAAVVGGSKDMSISHVYVAYKNGNIENSIDRLDTSISATSGIYHAIGTGSNIDWVRLPIYVSPRVSRYPEDTEEKTGNRVTFFATTASAIQKDGDDCAKGESINHFRFGSENGGTASQIFQIALVASPDRSTFLSDVLFSSKKIDIPMPMRDGEYIDIFWSLTFN